MAGDLRVVGAWTHSGVSFNLMSAGSMTGPGSLSAMSGVLIKGNASVTHLSVALNANAPAGLVVGGGALVLSGGGIWTCAVTTLLDGVLEFIAGAYVLNSPASFNGTAGSVVVGGSSTVRVNVGIALGSAAAINVTSGQLFVNGNTTMTEDAPLVVSSGAVVVTEPTTFTSLVTVSGGSLNISADVNLTGGLRVLSGTVFVLAGRVTVSGSTCSVSGGYVFVATAQALDVAAACSQSAGTLAGSGAVRWLDAVAWSGGLWTGTGATSVSGPLSISGAVTLSRSVWACCCACPGCGGC